jgi:DNA-binding transcriptional MerR regulator
MDKVLKPLKMIKDVAAEVMVAQHVIRFWETQFRNVQPIRRKGRKLYTQKDINALIEIKNLLHVQGYTIKGVKKYFSNSEESVSCMQDLLSQLTSLRDFVNDIAGRA